MLPSDTETRRRVTRALVSWDGVVEAGAFTGTSRFHGTVLPSWVNRTRKSRVTFVSLRISNHALCPRNNENLSYWRDRASLTNSHDAYNDDAPESS